MQEPEKGSVEEVRGRERALDRFEVNEEGCDSEGWDDQKVDVAGGLL